FASILLARGRRQPLLSLAVGAGAACAVCLTPALWHTVSYYHGVLTNAAAQQGQGQWQSLALSSPLDLIEIAAAAILAFKALRARPAAWELTVGLGLAAM